MKVFYDDFQNIAIITESMGLPYAGATKKEKEYILTLHALYDGGKMYHLSIHNTEDAALEKLKKYSCGSFKEEEQK